MQDLKGSAEARKKVLWKIQTNYHTKTQHPYLSTQLAGVLVTGVFFYSQVEQNRRLLDGKSWQIQSQAWSFLKLLILPKSFQISALWVTQCFEKQSAGQALHSYSIYLKSKWLESMEQIQRSRLFHYNHSSSFPILVPTLSTMQLSDMKYMQLPLGGKKCFIILLFSHAQQYSQHRPVNTIKCVKLVELPFNAWGISWSAKLDRIAKWLLPFLSS